MPVFVKLTVMSLGVHPDGIIVGLHQSCVPHLTQRSLALSSSGTALLRFCFATYLNMRIHHSCDLLRLSRRGMMVVRAAPSLAIRKVLRELFGARI